MQAECRAGSCGSCTDARRQGTLSFEYPRHDLGAGHTLWVLLKQVCMSVSRGNVLSSVDIFK